MSLAAARSASVVQAFAANNIISEDRLEAISYGNPGRLTQMGRQKAAPKARRIEIEINY